MWNSLSRRLSWSRFRIRFSLRALMVFVLLIGGTLGWFAYLARVQRDVVAAIEQADGSVWYEWERRNGKPVVNGRPDWPEWLVNRIGVDYFGAVVRVSLAQVGGDAELISASKLGTLRELVLDGSRVSDIGLAELGGLDQLRELSLMETRVTDAGLSHLVGLTNLKLLHLGNTAIGDPGLLHLKKLTGLNILGLRYTEVTDAGLAELEGLTMLQKLTLGGTKIGDEGLARLKGLKRLEFLGLNGTKITDAGLAYLKGLSCIKNLYLTHTNITDAGLVHLSELSILQRVTRMARTSPDLSGLARPRTPDPAEHPQSCRYPADAQREACKISKRRCTRVRILLDDAVQRGMQLAKLSLARDDPKQIETGPVYALPSAPA